MERGDFRVAVLMATKDGGRFLQEQLESIASQSHANWCLYVSDDASKDDTVAILEHFLMRTSYSIKIRPGPNSGYANNFMSLARDPKIEANYFAYCDQDDMWFDDKLARAIDHLCQVPRNVPALYCSRTLLVDEQNRELLGLSPLFARRPDFANALVQNIGGGNTMVFNLATKRLLEKTNTPVVAHDWWTYQIVTATGGVTIYDEKPSLKYRQHGLNAVGSKIGWAARSIRLLNMFQGQSGKWNEKNIDALHSIECLVTSENLKRLTIFELARKGPLLYRIANLWRSGVYRQTLAGNAGMYVAAALAKL